MANLKELHERGEIFALHEDSKPSSPAVRWEEEEEGLGHWVVTVSSFDMFFKSSLESIISDLLQKRKAVRGISTTAGTPDNAGKQISAERQTYQRAASPKSKPQPEQNAIAQAEFAALETKSNNDIDESRASSASYWRDVELNATNFPEAFGARLMGLNAAAGHDVADGVKGLYDILTDWDKLKSVLNQDLPNAQEIYDGLQKSAEQIAALPSDKKAEGAYKLLVGGLASAGSGKLATSVGRQVVKQRGFGAKKTLDIPQGLSKVQFDDLSKAVKSKADELGLGDDIFVQGSRANGTAKTTSDIDIAIRVSPEKFDDFLANQSKLGKVIPGSAKAKTLEHAIETGKIQAGEARLSPLRKQLEKELGMEVDLSVIKADGKFDNGSQLPLNK